MANEMKAGSGYVIPFAGGTPKQKHESISMVERLKGSTAFFHVPPGLHSVNQPPVGLGDPIRIGSNFPATLVNLHSGISQAILNACGIPPALFGSGSASREAFRFFMHSTLTPILNVIQEEAKAKLNSEVVFDLSELFTSDVTGKARAFQSMVKGGMELEKATALSGLMTEN